MVYDSLFAWGTAVLLGIIPIEFGRQLFIFRIEREIRPDSITDLAEGYQLLFRKHYFIVCTELIPLLNINPQSMNTLQLFRFWRRKDVVYLRYEPQLWGESTPPAKSLWAKLPGRFMQDANLAPG